jgi:glutathione S-transferase
MQLYFAPLACSMASRITAYEGQIEIDFIPVDLKQNRLPDGSDFRAINPIGQVPALATATGEILCENPVVLQYLADHNPSAGLVPRAGSIERYQLQQWLNFIGTELHKQVFIPLLDAKSPDGAKSYARQKALRPLARLEAHLRENDYLMDTFSIADAYLVTILNWSRFTGVDLTPYAAITAYFQRQMERPSVTRAMADEAALHAKEAAR